MQKEDFFRHTKTERNDSQQTCIIRNVKESPLGRSKMIPDKILSLHKEMGISGNGTSFTSNIKITSY